MWSEFAVAEFQASGRYTYGQRRTTFEAEGMLADLVSLGRLGLLGGLPGREVPEHLVPALDEKGWLVGAIANAILYTKDENMGLIVYGEYVIFKTGKHTPKRYASWCN